MNLVLQGMPRDFFGGAWYLFREYFPLFAQGVATTLLLAITGTIFGFLLSLIFASLKIQSIDKRDSKSKALVKLTGKYFSSMYITFFRGTPMIVQAMIFYYLFRSWGIQWSPLVAGLFVVTVNTTAYIAEVIRGGIGAIDKGQMEAARSLGFSRRKTMRLIILPQAIKNSIPAIGNEFIVNIKDTAVLSVIGVIDLYNATRAASSVFYRFTEGFFVAALIYLFLTYTSSKVLGLIEKRLDSNKVKQPESKVAEVTI
jgi:putative lysine transport system permease protein